MHSMPHSSYIVSRILHAKHQSKAKGGKHNYASLSAGTVLFVKEISMTEISLRIYPKERKPLR